MELETIVAPATPKGRSAIAGIRVSGPQGLAIVGRLFSPVASGRQCQDIPPFRPILGRIVDNGEIIDEVILVYYRAPKSYTREDMVEIFCHGNWIIVEKIINCLIKAGARLAEPGEFTMRALLNGRIDLPQAQLKFRGRVVFVDPEVESTNKTFLVRAEVENKGQILRKGLTTAMVIFLSPATKQEKMRVAEASNHRRAVQTR